jgi:Chitobiase/beta-hexosaminidase C-terminal domain/Fn3 associated
VLNANWTTTTVQAYAVALGHMASAVATATYTIGPTLIKPVFTPPAGAYPPGQTVTISDGSTNTIYYTTDGTVPTTTSMLYSGPISIDSGLTINAIAVRTGYTNSPIVSATYTIAPVLPAPTFTLPGGTYTSASVGITEAVSGATIYYTTNENPPTTASAKYLTPIQFDSETTITVKAIAVKSGYQNSTTSAATYIIAPPLARPVFSPPAGSYTTPQMVAISDTSRCTIYYTTDGSTPTTSSVLYSGPITVSANETINAIAVRSGYTNSPVTSAVYTVEPQLPTPTFSLAAGFYKSSVMVSIMDSLAGATIYYTTDHATPTTSSPVYGGTPITISSTERLQAIAVAPNYSPSAVAQSDYYIATAEPVLSLPSGTYTSPQMVTITDSTPGAVIYYTTDGTVPNRASPTISSGGSITVSASETLKAIAVAAGYTASPQAAAWYTISP